MNEIMLKCWTLQFRTSYTHLTNSLTREMHGTQEHLNIVVTRSGDLNANAWSCWCSSRIKAGQVFGSAGSSIGQIFHLKEEKILSLQNYIGPRSWSINSEIQMLLTPALLCHKGVLLLQYSIELGPSIERFNQRGCSTLIKCPDDSLYRSWRSSAQKCRPPPERPARSLCFQSPRSSPCHSLEVSLQVFS